MSGQTFQAPTENNPAKTAFYGRTGWWSLQNTAYASVAKENASYNLCRFLRQPGLWVSGRLVPGPNTKINYNWIKEPIEISPTEVTITIRHDAKWSDGRPITGKDIAYIPIEQTLAEYFSPPAYAPDQKTEPKRVLFAFDNFEIRKKSVTFRSSPGYFEQFWNHDIAFRLGPALPSLSPTHIEPFDAYADAVIDTARQAKAGDIFPWYQRGYGDPHRDSLIRKYLENPKYVRKFSKPENVLATGAWDLVEFRGTKEFVFEKNPHHRHADAINFDSVIFNYTPSAERERAVLKANRLDYAAPGTTPQEVINSLPENISYLRIPGVSGEGNGLKMSFHHPALGTREVRMAIMYALDQPTIAKNIHQSVAEPVSTPGGDCWDATDYVSQEWIDENLTTYTMDREKAASLMREVGYTKSGGQWRSSDGEPLTLTIPTPSDTPRWEPGVASQLTEFGIPTTVNTLDQNAFRGRVENGEFPIWPATPSYLTSLAQDALLLWHDAVTERFYGIYPKQQYKMGEFSNGGTPLPRTEDRWRVFTIQAPPIGQPDGPLQEYHPAALALAFQTNPPKDEFRRRVKISLWLANWFLPSIPINKRYVQHFIDDAHWLWPTETPTWQSFVDGDFRPPGEVLASLNIRANRDNPDGGNSNIQG